MKEALFPHAGAHSVPPYADVGNGGFFRVGLSLDFPRGLEVLKRLGTVRLSNGVPTAKMARHRLGDHTPPWLGLKNFRLGDSGLQGRLGQGGALSSAIRSDAA
jgi:hypothetical protein